MRLPLAGGFEPRLGQFEIGQDEPQRVVDLVGDTGREQADARHLLHLHELFLGLVQPGQRRLELATLGEQAAVGQLEIAGSLANPCLQIRIETLELAHETGVLFDQAHVFDRAHKGQTQGLDGLVLPDVVEGSLVDGAQDLAGARNRREHDDRSFDGPHAQGGQKLDARHLGHVEVSDDNIEASVLECRQRGLAAIGDLDLEPPVRDQATDEVANQRAVVDQQDPSSRV